MKISEYKFSKEYIPLASKYHEYDEKYANVQRDIQKYIQVELMGKYNPNYTVAKSSIQRAGLDKDKKYLKMLKLEAKYKKIRDNYGKLALKYIEEYIHKYGYSEYSRCCNKYF